MTLEYLEVGATVTRGVLAIHDRTALARLLRGFKDGPVSIRIQVERAQRSNQQNRFWHGVVIPLFAEHCGYDFEDMKDELSLKLIPREITDMTTGEVKIVPGHTSKLNTKEFNELIERAQRLGAELGIYIPDPGEYERQTA